MLNLSDTETTDSVFVQFCIKSSESISMCVFLVKLKQTAGQTEEKRNPWFMRRAWHMAAGATKGDCRGKNYSLYMKSRSREDTSCMKSIRMHRTFIKTQLLTKCAKWLPSKRTKQLGQIWQKKASKYKCDVQFNTFLLPELLLLFKIHSPCLREGSQTPTHSQINHL